MINSFKLGDIVLCLLFFDGYFIFEVDRFFDAGL